MAAVPQQSSSEVDPISKFKLYIPALKESLANLMKVAAQIFFRNSQIDSTVKVSEENQKNKQRFEQKLEDFYSICDQIELNLRIAIECNHQNMDSGKNTPIPVTLGKPPDHPQNQENPQYQSYPQYLATVKTQIACAKELHNTLVECARKIEQHQGQSAQIVPMNQAQQQAMTSQPQR
ncbi:unnamed protein product [Owenia fusiformis]|uniref:Mediator of RNA polymerase II transcription subunit 29 n=1 Tax=Owenia fusiformis TaxID=6347 RepID=A0A8S4PG06_OWEFU|nr:unnamed protein product [Owenia fusiformis]